MRIHQLFIPILFVLATLMGACTNTGDRRASSTHSSSYAGAMYGVIESIDVASGESAGIGAGAVIGGVVGGVLGHQVGGGTGKDVATVAGVVGGAVVGHEIEKRNQPQQNVYHVRVRLDNGGFQTMTQEDIFDLRVGDRVRIENDNVYRY